MKPLNIILKSRLYIVTFAIIGVDASLRDDAFDVLQQFVCDLCGQKRKSTNTLRYRLYSSKQGRLEAKIIPSCLDSLRLHVSRATYQLFVWRSCLIAKPEIPSPLDYRWETKDDESISVKWNTVKPASEKILELVYCTCSKRCDFESCSCIQNRLLCTDACTKVDCQNYCDVDIREGQDDEYSSDEDDFEEM